MVGGTRWDTRQQPKILDRFIEIVAEMIGRPRTVEDMATAITWIDGEISSGPSPKSYQRTIEGFIMPSEMEEKEAIRDLMYRYCFITDREKDPDKWITLFAEDGIWDGNEFGRLQGHDQLRAFMVEATSGGGAGFRHFTTNVLIDVNGDEANGKCYFLLMQDTENGPVPFYAGYYDDRFVKSEGEWLFAERLTRKS